MAAPARRTRAVGAAPALDDDERVAALHRPGVLDQPPAADLEGLTRLATFVTGAPDSALNLLDRDRQWQAATTGAAPRESPRTESMCAHTVTLDEVVHVADASGDPRFANSAFVDGQLSSVRMYAAVPVHDHEGYAVGSLCVVDPSARTLSDEQLSALRDLAAQAEYLLEMRRQHLLLLDVLAEVDHFASHDPLTGLVNRRVLVDRLELALQRAERTGVAPTLFFCDVDDFKAVNDTLGHQAGDDALVEVAQHLRALVRSHDTVARLGGDEFVILCEDVDEDAVETVAQRLRARLPGPHGLHLSVGHSTPTAPCSPVEALAGADVLMYADKVRRRAEGAR